MVIRWNVPHLIDGGAGGHGALLLGLHIVQQTVVVESHLLHEEDYQVTEEDGHVRNGLVAVAGELREAIDALGDEVPEGEGEEHATGEGVGEGEEQLGTERRGGDDCDR